MILDTQNLKLRKGVIPTQKKSEKRVDSGIDMFKQNIDDNRRVLQLAQRYWEDLEDWRTRSTRNFKYFRGKQWHEYVTITNRDGTSVQMTEEDYIKSQGRVPFKQNLVYPIIRSKVSQYRANPSKSIAIARAKENGTKSEMLTNILQAELEANEVGELDARNLESYMLYATAAQKVTYQYQPSSNSERLFLENISYDRLFFNSGIKDVRLLELNFVGHIIDAPLDKIISKFAQNDKKREEAIRQIFSVQSNAQYTGGVKALTKEDSEVNDFFLPYDNTLCRVFETWEQKYEWMYMVHDYYDGTRKPFPMTTEVLANVTRINAERVAYYAQNGISEDQVPKLKATPIYEQYWNAKYLTANAECLHESRTVYEHEEHPFALGMQIVNGETWSEVEGLIDQNRIINRLIIAQEFARSAASKGVLIVPDDSIPDDMSIEDVAEEWVKYNGVIKLRLKPGAVLPYQVSSRAIDPDSNASIQMQMDFMMRVGGVSDAIQGITPKSGTPASRYAQESQNSSMNNVDTMQSFNTFKRRRDKKALSIIRQFYEDRIITIAGKAYADQAQYYKASEAKAMKDVDIIVVQGSDSPIYRSVMDEQLFAWVDTDKIDIELALTHCSYPFAEALLSDIQKRRKEAEAAMAQPQQVMPQPQQQAQITA